MTEPSATEQPDRSQPDKSRADKSQPDKSQPAKSQPDRSRADKSQPDRSRAGAGSSADSWEQRAAGLASEIQRWLIRTSARTVRDELGGQVKKAFRGPERNTGDSWATATTEPPHAADEAPECAWCPVCRAARRIAQARTAGTDSRGGPRLSDAADVMAGAVRDALAGIDSILSYRPSGSGGGSQATAAPARPERPAAAESVPPDGPAGPDGPDGPGGPAGPGEPGGSSGPGVEDADDASERASG